jgi:hypothetical protein
VCKFHGMRCFEGEVERGVGHQLEDLLYIVGIVWGVAVGAVGCGGRVG